MQPTANLWEVLCRDLEIQSTHPARENHLAAAQRFKETALQVFSKSSTRLADAFEISGDVCQASGFFTQAVEDFKISLTRNQEAGTTAAAARVTAKLALLLEHQGEETASRHCYAEALDLYEKSHDFSQHGMLASNLAGLEKRAGNFSACERHYLQALEITAKLHGEIDPSVADVCNNLAVAYTEADEWIRAENLHMRALGIREKLYGSMHPDVAQSLANIAVLYHASSNFEKARAYYEAAMKTYLSFKAPDAPELVSLRAGLEKLNART